LRHCSIQAQSESNDTVCVSSQTTKSGGFTPQRDSRVGVKYYFNWL
jgi:hypothetical protein